MPLQGARPQVRWVRLDDVAAIADPMYVCCRCGDGFEKEDGWVTIPFSAAGKQMLQGYIHCNMCRLTVDPQRAWKEAHDKDPWTSHRA